jgi:hypothetical protein
LGDKGEGGRIILKWNLNMSVSVWTRFNQLNVKFSCRIFKHSNEWFGSLKGGEFLDQLNDSCSLKEDSTPLGDIRSMLVPEDVLL